MEEIRSEIPLGLYIHLPWCRRKCPYCDFNSHRHPVDLSTAAQHYANALLREWRARAQLAQGRSITSLYCGGGTPNLLPPEWYARLFAALREQVEFAPDCELTLEANPGEGRIHDYAGYVQAGFNRISLGVQSFQGATLEALGRDYTPEQLEQSLTRLSASGVRSFNLDLLFAAPGQTPTMLGDDLAQALAWNTPHLSCYELTLEPNTVFFSHPPDGLPQEEMKHHMFAQVEKTLLEKDFAHYEISAYVKKGHACRHNINYWEFGDYLALGAGAHAKITLVGGNRLLRYANPKSPASYVALHAFPEPHAQPRKEWFFQFCLNAFRLQGGVSLKKSANRLLTTPEKLLTDCRHLIATGAMLVQGDRLQLARRAWLNQNNLLETMV